MAQITVEVADERVPDFYQVVGLFLSGKLTLPGEGSGQGTQSLSETSKAPAATVPWGNTAQDQVDAETLWKKYSPRARAMFSLLIDTPGKEFTGEQIAEACDIPNGAHGVAGVLAWPGRHGAAIGRGLPTEWREDGDTLEGLYWMSTERAALFEAARCSVENS